MRFAEGNSYKIVNQNTKAEGYFQAHEVLSYKGHYVLYGTLNKRGWWLPATVGHQEDEARPAAFPVINAPTPELLDAFCKDLFMSLDLYIEDRNDSGQVERLRIPNMQPLPGWSPSWGTGINQVSDIAALKQAAVKMVDLWNYTMEHDGQFPLDYLVP